jgi:hypothetical protein
MQVIARYVRILLAVIALLSNASIAFAQSMVGGSLRGQLFYPDTAAINAFSPDVTTVTSGTIEFGATIEDRDFDRWGISVNMEADTIRVQVNATRAGRPETVEPFRIALDWQLSAPPSGGTPRPFGSVGIGAVTGPAPGPFGLGSGSALGIESFSDTRIVLRHNGGVGGLDAIFRVRPFDTNLRPENGASLPTQGELRIFLVFAEVDFSTGSTIIEPAENKQKAIWPEHRLPTDAESYFSHSFAPPLVGVTAYFSDMSMGTYKVLGDYYPFPITVDCTQVPCGGFGADRDRVAKTVVQALQLDHQGRHPPSGSPASIRTAHEYTLNAFDLWDITPATTAPAGRQKLKIANGMIDALIIMWRNYDPVAGRLMTSGARGYGVAFAALGTPLESGLTGDPNDKTDFENVGSFSAPNGGPGAIGLILAEYFHTLFGGNNWHTGSGAGEHTFQAPQGSFSLTAQSSSASDVVNGWDRQHLGWKHPAKQHLISALDERRSEVPTDVGIASLRQGGTFILRDFVATGDAIRIKLPHVRWNRLGAPKNQYLWIENHRLKSEFDRNNGISPGDRLDCHTPWKPGIYAYLQVGKDAKGQDLNGDDSVDAVETNIYSWDPQHPNGLASWLFPLTAEGNFDFYWRLDQVKESNPQPCQFGNDSIPFEKARSLPNPFTGGSEVFWQIDSDRIIYANPAVNIPTLVPLAKGTSATLIDGDLRCCQPNGAPFGRILSEFVGGAVVYHLPQFGDAEDAFSMATGKSSLSISTNPAPVPVYTRQSAWGFGSPSNLIGSPSNPGAPPSFENRTIWLNGLSVEILQENVDDSGAVKVAIRWDDYRVTNDVRWTGEIVLQNDVEDPLRRQSQIVVAEGRNLYLDRGLSPTQYFAEATRTRIVPRGVDNTVYPENLATETQRLFSQPSKLTLRRGTKLQLERNAKIWVQNGSRLEIENGVEIVLGPGADFLAGHGRGTITINGTVFGDLNGDNVVDIRDLALILADILRPGPHNPAHDLNHDQRVDSADARKLVSLFTNP